ncbi:MAG: hypothetical protein ABI912_03105 [Actinomycetota bacterium]
MRVLAGVGVAALIIVLTPTSASAATTHRPHFRTPQAAMRYLARAYNRHDDARLRHVTTPDARRDLEAMRAVATNLRLDHCTRSPNGMAFCTFTHDYPSATPGMPPQHGGSADLRVAPVRRSGWVAKGEIGCG